MKEVVAYTVPVHNNLEILIVHFTKKNVRFFPAPLDMTALLIMINS